MSLRNQKQLTRVFCKTDLLKLSSIHCKVSVESFFSKTVSPPACNCTKKDDINGVFM